MSGSATTPEPGPEPDPALDPELDPLEIQLQREHLVHYQWMVALQRPVLPFLAYTSVILVLAALTGIWPQAGAFAPAALFPLVAYLLWVPMSGRALWRRAPGLADRRVLVRDPGGYVVTGPSGSDRVPWGEVEDALLSSRLLALRRRNGAADLVPWSLPGTEALLRAAEDAGVEVRRSAFLG